MTSLNPFLRISTQLTEVLDVHRDISEEKARAAAIEMLEKVGIPGAAERVDNYPHEFSGGMRQRVMIAMALLCEPELLIADEPTTALDVTIQAQILDLIKDLKTDLNTSVIVITHDLGVVAGMADRILVMYGGRAMEEADAKDLFRRPAHPYTVGMLKSVPRIDRGKEEKLIPIEGNPPDASKEIPGCPFAERCNWAVDKCEEEFPEPVEVEERRRSYCWRAKEVYDAKIGSRASAERLEKVEDHIAAGHTVDDDFLAELNKGRDGTTADTETDAG
jgi:oligopeptide transport system ATP-binding protein